MSKEPTNSRAKIGELQCELARATKTSREALDHGMEVAWQIGRLFDIERKRVRRSMGREAWRHWLAENFRGSQRLAERYLQLARTVDNPDTLTQLSLRQVYLRLGISTEPKTRANALRLPSLPGHVRNAQRLLLSVRMKLRLRQMDEEQRRRLCDDLAPLHRQLVLLFAPHQPPRTGGSHSGRNNH
jgi:hypothetical protein